MRQLFKLSHISILLLFIFYGCDLETDPLDSKPDEVALNTIEDIQTATIGNYHLFQGNADEENYYMKGIKQIGSHRTDNVMYSGSTTDPIFFTYTYNHNVDAENILLLYRSGYRIIFGTNKVIERLNEMNDSKSNQLLGENLFLRSLVHFQLLNFFARPYTQGDPSSALGIPIVEDVGELNGHPARNTVKEVYDFITENLERAAQLMSEEKENIFASKEAAWALLSRVYLYRGENQKAIDYADSVINSAKYQLLSTSSYKSYFTFTPENNSETIFAIKGTTLDDHGNSAIGSLFYTSPGGAGWGEVYASEQYRNLLDEYPEDVRHSFIQLDENEDGTAKTRNGYPKWFVLKYSNQEGHATVSSPVILRLAEMYLNRAEAYAKLGGHDQEALDDVNLIRDRAGLDGDALYTVSDLHGLNSVLAAVLQERRIEFAFEGTRSFDLFRNNLPLYRDYPGTHLNPSNPGVDMENGTQTILPTDNRIIFFFPEQELDLNPNLKQNP